MKHNLRFKRLVGLLALCFLPLAAAADTLTDRARGLIEAGKGTEAFRLLEPLEGERAGDPAYDLLLGIAALDAGQDTRGIFALERVLAIDPNNVRARAEIARAYMAVGEAEAARSEFETARKQGIPPEVAGNFDKLLTTIDRMQDASRTAIRGYVEATVGYDTNVNAAPNRSTVAIPGLNPFSDFVLSPDGRSRADGFGALGGGVSVRHALTKEFSLFGGLAGNQRWNFDASRFDTGSLDAHAGIMYTRDRNTLSLTAQYSPLYLDNDEFRTASGATALWQHNLDSRNQLSAFVQYSSLRYHNQSIRDAGRTLAGGAYAHAFQEGQMVFVSAYGVRENEKNAGVPWIGHEGYGLRGGSQWSISPKTSLFGSVAYEHRRYGDTDPSFLLRRVDNQSVVNIGLNYALSKALLLTPQFTYTNNSSNSSLNDYRREVTSVTIRREF